MYHGAPTLLSPGDPAAPLPEVGREGTFGRLDERLRKLLMTGSGSRCVAEGRPPHIRRSGVVGAMSMLDVDTGGDEP